MALSHRELRFRDRSHAGQLLAARLAPLRHEAPIVLAIPGGGVPVAVEVARALGADLDVLIVQPVRAPTRAKLVIGVLAEGGAVTIDRGQAGALSDEDIDHATLRARRELLRHARVYRRGRPLPALEGRTVIIVDDGILTSRTMRAALATRAPLQPRRLIAAAPVAATMAVHLVKRAADDVVTVVTSGDLRAVADAYEDFHPLADVEVLGELARGRAAVQADAEIVVAEVDVEIGATTVSATLTLPRGARGVVVSCTAGPERRSAARADAFTLVGHELGSLILDVADGPAAFVGGVDWARRFASTTGLRVGLLGEAENGAAEAARARIGVVHADSIDEIDALL